MLGFRKYLQSLTEARITKVEDLLPLRTIRFILVFSPQDDLSAMFPPQRTEKEKQFAAVLSTLAGFRDVKKEILKRLRQFERQDILQVTKGAPAGYRSVEDIWIVDVYGVTSEKDARTKLKNILTNFDIQGL